MPTVSVANPKNKNLLVQDMRNNTAQVTEAHRDSSCGRNRYEKIDMDRTEIKASGDCILRM